ncbi:MAG: hypothetical protein A3J47_00215 [Candidatus Yanofskybacteria bacterium RIFCSPHIGHO2_02_FULL_43_22]|uniref:Uncharacterized protein n=1 Tax=Candidatus Yanofskybacteria bacterium RIFCSPHIGHO2_02_FULL_43_22 TaxID=1802681 RepID=A0A1F8FSJ8_9BACT|nr:MAG: hypothetical protein A3J47_00215 [Candidatus Yanofskybacteria bacterium RIFCSPHIGHO2_02_FULL_43_22]
MSYQCFDTAYQYKNSININQNKIMENTQNKNNTKEQIIIDFDFIQELGGEGHLERELTAEELETIFYEISDNLWEFIARTTDQVIEFNELLEANKNAKNAFPHYKVMWKNENAYQKEFRERYCFLTLANARDYIHHDFISEYDIWRVYRVEQDGSETEVYKIH